MNLPLFFAFLSPAIFGFMNVFDTYIVKRKVKNVLGFAIVSGVTNILFGIILALFLDWSAYSFSDFRFSILAGASLGVQLCFYYFTLSKHDVSHAVGLTYVYPIIVAILSFLFLNEKLSFIGYLGMILTLAGVLLMNMQIKKLKIKIAIWSILILIITAALNELFVKIATSQINGWNGTAISSIVMGLFVMPLLLKKNVRKGFRSEFKRIKLTFISEALTIAAIGTLYLAMAGLPATIVSVISVTQPLFVLLFEWTAFSIGIKIVKDINWKNKLFAILLIVLGIIVLYISEIV